VGKWIVIYFWIPYICPSCRVYPMMNMIKQKIKCVNANNSVLDPNLGMEWFVACVFRLSGCTSIGLLDSLSCCCCCSWRWWRRPIYRCWRWITYMHTRTTTASTSVITISVDDCLRRNIAGNIAGAIVIGPLRMMWMSNIAYKITSNERKTCPAETSPFVD